jgi:biopolymer transport protein ExbD
MKHALLVCFAATIFMGAVVHLGMIRQSFAQAHSMQRGVSVEMATARNAKAWPGADDNDAWIVTVDNTGQLYIGTDPTTEEELKQWMIQHPRRRDQKLYIKADARAPYASVEKALDAATTAEFAEPVLLVNQRDASAQPGVVVPPKGLAVAVGSQTPSGTVATVAELILSGQKQPLVKINEDEIAWSAFDAALQQRFQRGDDKLVLLKAAGRLPYAEVVSAVEICRAAGAKVYLAEPEL